MGGQVKRKELPEATNEARESTRSSEQLEAPSPCRAWVFGGYTAASLPSTTGLVHYL